MATTLIAKIAARAKVIRKSNPKMTWQSALKKAGAELKGSGAKTTSKRRVGVVARTKKGKTVKRIVGNVLLPEHKKYFKKISLAQAKKRFNNNLAI